MPLSDHFELMHRVCAKVRQQNDWPLESYFRSGLVSLKEFSAEYDSIVDEKNPFYQEFTKYIKRDSLEVDELFSLFECMVIFIRMRQMSAPNLALSSREQSVLDYFETCGEWAATTTRLFATGTGRACRKNCAITDRRSLSPVLYP